MSSTKQQLQRAAAEISGRVAIPDIDFTQHRLDDGSTVSTQERVIKEVRHILLHALFNHFELKANMC